MKSLINCQEIKMQSLIIIVVLSLISTMSFAKDVKDSPDTIAVLLSHVDTNMNAVIVNSRDAVHSAAIRLAAATKKKYNDGTVTKEVVISEIQAAELERAHIVCLSSK